MLGIELGPVFVRLLTAGAAVGVVATGGGVVTAVVFGAFDSEVDVLEVTVVVGVVWLVVAPESSLFVSLV